MAANHFGRRLASCLLLAVTACSAAGAKLAIRRGVRAEIVSRSRAPWNFVRPSDILIAERPPETLGFLQSSSIGAGFLYLADDLQLVELQASDESVRAELAVQAVRRLPTGKRLWWLGAPSDACADALEAAGFERVSAGESARALWPALAFFATPIALAPSLGLAFLLRTAGLAALAELEPAQLAALACAPPALGAAALAAALRGTTILRAAGTRRAR
jgi:hypothetical protein